MISEVVYDMKKSNLFFALITLFLMGSFTMSLPMVNQKVVEFCKSKIGQQVDRGECWDLAKYSLEYAGADWIPPLDYGDNYNYKKVEILPGDIIQFENAKFEWDLGRMSFPVHTAVVMENKGDNLIIIAHQNFAGKRTVQLTEINLTYLKKGKLDFYRPKK